MTLKEVAERNPSVKHYIVRDENGIANKIIDRSEILNKSYPLLSSECCFGIFDPMSCIATVTLNRPVFIK